MIRTRLIIHYVFLISFPMIPISYAHYKTSLNIILKHASDSMQEIVQKNNQYTDMVLGRVKDRSLSLLADPDLFHLFDRMRPKDLLELLQMDRERRVLDGGFPDNIRKEVMSVSGKESKKVRQGSEERAVLKIPYHEGGTANDWARTDVV